MPARPRPDDPADVESSLDRLTAGKVSAGAAPGPWKRILVALDPFGDYGPALSWAVALGGPKAQIGLILVLSPDEILGELAHGSPKGTDASGLRLREEQDAQKIVAEARRRLGKTVRVEALLPRGMPTQAILHAIDDRRADLVILGSHGHGRMDRFMLGSVADGVKNHAPCDVLISRAAFKAGGLLAPVDGSDRSRRSARLALRLSRDWGQPVSFMHVFGSNLLRYADIGKEEFQAVIKKDRLPKASADTHYVLDFGSPAKQIVKYAKHHQPALIVMGSRGLGAVAGTVMGSSSNRVAHESPVSCLFVKR